MKKDHHLAYIKNIRRPVIDITEVTKGKHVGMLSAYLTRGRDVHGKPIRGQRVYLYHWDVLWGEEEPSDEHDRE